MTLTVRLRYLARYAELLGVESEELALPAPATVADVISAVRARHPAAAQLPAKPLCAVNFRQALWGDPVAGGDEVALLPPVAGG
ncbi:MAG TPA: MoaD/ThiS family protein [Gemmatimonadales bacterium]|nr:MoaD/ThiS family protein [Gemmatimonadales bacterium]